MTLVLFLAKVIICSGALFGYYFFFLRNKKFHQYNRYYLLAGAAFSLVFPLLQIPVLYSGNASDGVLLNTLNVITVTEWEDEFVMTAHQSVISLITFQNVALVIYLGAVTLFIYNAIRSVLYIKRISRVYEMKQIDRIRFYNTSEPGTPFSFFNRLFWDEKIPLESEKGQHILRHELFHIRARHSYDVVFIKCLTTLF